MSSVSYTIPFIISLSIYKGIGGDYPLTVLSIQTITLALLAMLIHFGLLILVWSPYIGYSVRVQRAISSSSSKPIINFFLLALALPAISHPFAILAAGLYAKSDLLEFGFMMLGLIVIAYITRRFSWVAESSRQQSRQLDRLERLGRAILGAPPDMSTLPDILEQHVPGMFPSGNIAIWLEPDYVLYIAPEDWSVDMDVIQEWMGGQNETQAFLSGSDLPWTETTRHHSVIVTPINSADGVDVIGCVYLEVRTLAQPWDMKTLRRLFPAVHALADQISSALQQADDFASTIAYQKMSHELKIAGQIQASFFPSEFPNIPGWQLAVSLEPAGGLSGDFFDFIPLSNGRLGVVVGDVVDKGLGAALYMALCRTLLRTYSLEYQSRPDIVFSEVNERILSDARANLFITVFYGILDPNEGTLTYCNAGHNPPFLISNDQDVGHLPLTRTGMPIGIDEDARWIRRSIDLHKGDLLILYTDGVTEAQNIEGQLFNEDLLLEVAEGNLGVSAYDMQNAILERIHDFVGDAPQFDDITLMILTRDL
jgi:serine phosphatase RsbU (regulator of sigma subunit)